MHENRIRAALRTFVTLLAMGAVLVACGRIDPQAEMVAAEESYAARRFSEAAIRVSNVIQAQPENAAAWKLRGDVGLATGDFAAAVAAFERAQALGFPPPSLAIGLAAARNELGRVAEALALLDSVSEALERDPAYWLTRAEALVRLGRTTEAEIALASGEGVGAGGGRVDMVRALISFARDDVAGAEATLAGALSRAPNDPALLKARGELYVRGGRLAQAADDFLRAADIYREEALEVRELSALMSLAQVHLTLNDLEAAETVALRIAERAPVAGFTNYVRGLVAYRQGKFDEAASFIQPLVNGQPDTVLFRGLLGAIHLARGNFNQAEQQFLGVLADAPRDPVAIKLLAETRLRQERPEAALSALRAVADAVGQDAQLGFLNGLASLQLGDTEQALFYLEQAASLDPANEMLKLHLARAYLAVGRDADASTLLEGALTGGDGSADTRLLRLLADIRRGATDAALVQAEQLLEEFPRDARVLTAVAGLFQLQGNVERARQLFREAAEVETEGVTARLFVAASLAQEGRRDEAEALLDRVLADQPENPQVLTALAELRLADGELAEAVALLTRAAESSPSVMPRLLLVQILLREGDLAEAKRHLELATRAAPDRPEVVAVAGVLALAEQRVPEAQRLLQEAHAKLPNRLGITLALARAQLAGPSPQTARATLSNALAVAPRSLPLRLALGQTELQLGNADEAKSIANDIKAEFPSQSAGYLLEAEAEIAARRYTAAADSLANAFEREPVWAVLIQRVRALQLAGRGADAVAVTGDWVEANPAHVQGKLLLASLLQGAGRAPEALRVFREILTLDADNLVALNDAAWLAHSLGSEDALALAERAHAVAGDNPSVLDTLGWILLSHDRAGESIEYLGRAAELAPGVPEIRYHFAAALVAGGQPDEARRVLTALMAGPDFEQRAAARRLLDSL